jgi:hypothetical protein
MNHQHAVAHAQSLLNELMTILPLARKVGRIEDWSKQYASAYIFKIRMMR